MKMVRYAVTALLTGAALTASFVACDQPKTRCTVTSLTFIAKYEKVSGPDDCPTYERFRGASYFAELKDNPGFVGQPDLNDISMALKPLDLANKLDRADTAVANGAGAYDESKTYIFSKFDQVLPDDQEFCTIGNFTQQLDITLPALAAGKDNKPPAEPPTRYQYTFTNYKSYVTAPAPGTTFTADLTRVITKEGSEPQTCVYKVRAMAPYIGCEPREDPAIRDIDCSPIPNPDAGHPSGAPLNPDFNIVCDTSINVGGAPGACFPPDDQAFPPLKAQ